MFLDLCLFYNDISTCPHPLREYAKNATCRYVPFLAFLLFCVFVRFSSPQVIGLKDEKKAKTYSILTIFTLFLAFFRYFRHINAIHSTCVVAGWGTGALT